jgi:hypothetical protein
MFKKWDSEENYGARDPEAIYADGALPKGTQVRFRDGTYGSVVAGNPERSLIEHAAPAETGASTERNWYSNDILEIEVPRS